MSMVRCLRALQWCPTRIRKAETLTDIELCVILPQKIFDLVHEAPETSAIKNNLRIFHLN